MVELAIPVVVTLIVGFCAQTDEIFRLGVVATNRRNLSET